MVLNPSTLDEINILASDANWAWPEVLRDILRPRGVNLLVADRADEFVDIIKRRRIHTAIVDMDWNPARRSPWQSSNALATIRIIRMHYPRLPCILLARKAPETILAKALQLDVFSVIDKPVDMSILLEQLNRLFIKKYNCNIFAE